MNKKLNIAKNHDFDTLKFFNMSIFKFWNFHKKFEKFENSTLYNFHHLVAKF